MFFWKVLKKISFKKKKSKKNPAQLLGRANRRERPSPAGSPSYSPGPLWCQDGVTGGRSCRGGVQDAGDAPPHFGTRGWAHRARLEAACRQVGAPPLCGHRSVAGEQETARRTACTPAAIPARSLRSGTRLRRGGWGRGGGSGHVQRSGRGGAERRGGGGGDVRRRGREKGREGRSVVVLQKSPHVFAESQTGPALRWYMNCGFYLRFSEGFFCKSVIDAFWEPSDRWRTAGIAAL